MSFPFNSFYVRTKSYYFIDQVFINYFMNTLLTRQYGLVVERLLLTPLVTGSNPGTPTLGHIVSVNRKDFGIPPVLTSYATTLFGYT